MSTLTEQYTAYALESAPVDKELRRSAVLRGLTYGALLLTFLLAFLTIIFPLIRGAIPLTVLSNSMAPAMPVGSLAIVLPTQETIPADQTEILTPEEIRAFNDVSGIHAGDVIVFQPNPGDPMLVMHRVQDVRASVQAATGQSRTTFTTRGDNLDVDDAPVEDFQVRGRVLYSLPLLGYVNNLLNTGPNANRTTLLVAVVGYSFALFYLGKAVLQGRKARH